MQKESVLVGSIHLSRKLKSEQLTHPQNWSNASPQPVPIFGVVALCPFEEGGIETRLICNGVMSILEHEALSWTTYLHSRSS